MIGLLAGLALALAALVLWPDDDASLTSADVDAAIATALAEQATPLLASNAYEQASPALVGVRAITDGEEPTSVPVWSLTTRVKS